MARLVYEVRFKGAAPAPLRASFDDVELRVDDASTVIVCDPQRLDAVTSRLEVLGLELLEVRLVAFDERAG